jgi:hypothetical protein
MRTNLLCGLSLSLLVATGCGVDTLPPDGDPDEDPNGSGPDAGPPAPGSNRVTDGLQLLYRFEGAPGQTTIDDTSGVGDPINLTIRDPEQVTWEGGYLNVIGPTIVEHLNPISKVTDACRTSHELTLELWLMNASTEEPPLNGYVIASGDPDNNQSRNFGLHQQVLNWDGHLRTDQNNAAGSNPTALASSGDATTEIQHIVYTRDSATGTVDYYIDGIKGVPRTVKGAFNWELEYGLSIANQPTLDRPWLGTLYLAAVYCRELSPSEIQQNYEDGY